MMIVIFLEDLAINSLLNIKDTFAKIFLSYLWAAVKVLRILNPWVADHNPYLSLIASTQFGVFLTKIKEGPEFKT